MKDSCRDCCECLRIGFLLCLSLTRSSLAGSSVSFVSGLPLECSLLNFTVQQQHSFSVVKEVWCHRHTTATSTDAVESSTSNPSTTTDDERFLAEVSTIEVSTTGASTTEMFTVGVSPDTNSDEYYYQSSESKDGFCPNADWTCTPLNIARTCGSFDSEGGSCSGLNAYPNATTQRCRMKFISAVQLLAASMRCLC